MQAPVDAERMRRALLEAMEHTMDSDRRYLPPSVLRKIADPRMFALRVATQEIIDELKPYSEECHRYVADTFDAYHTHREALAPRIPGRIRSVLSGRSGHWHTPLNGARWNDDSLTLFLNPMDEHNPSRVRSVTFQGCEILHGHDLAALIESYWYYHELDLSQDGRYAVGIVFQISTPCIEYRFLELLAKDITFTIHELSEEERLLAGKRRENQQKLAAYWQAHKKQQTTVE
jgi:hypothetical protein